MVDGDRAVEINWVDMDEGDEYKIKGLSVTAHSAGAVL